ncbi:MAG: GAF domain-containing protein [Armatimonadota bacterium]
MPLSPSHTSAIRKIAELTGSGTPADNRIEQILSVAREAVSADIISVVASIGAGGPAEWHSSFSDSHVDLDVIRKAAAYSSGTAASADNLNIFPLQLTNGFRATMVALGKLDADNTDLLQIVSSYVSVLVENSRLEKEVEESNTSAHRRIKEIAAIYEIGQATNTALVDPLLDMIVAKAAAVMDAQTCSIMLRDERENVLVIGASYGLTDDIIKGTRIPIGEGIAGQVTETGEPMLIMDVANDARFRRAVKPRAGVSGSMCVPLKDEDGSVIGVLSIRRHTPNPPFSPQDLKLFSVFATHAALAITNAQLYSQLHRKVQEMSRISNVLRAINSTLDLDDVLNQIVESITESVGFDRCCVYLLDSRNNEFTAGARRGYRPLDKIADHIKSDQGVIGLAAKEQIPIFSQGSPVEPNAVEGTGEFLVAPIVVRDTCIGVVVVDNCHSNRPIEPEHVELLATFVSQAGIAVENARLYEAMEEKYAEMNALYEHSRNISAAYGLDNAAEMLVKTASRAVRCDGAGLLLLDTKRGRLRFCAASGGLADVADDVQRFVEQESSVDFVRDLRTPALIAPIRSSSEKSGLLDALAPNGSNLMMAPLVAEDTTVGALAIYRHQPNEFLGSELKLVSIMTSHAATVLKNAMSYEQKMRQHVLELTALYEFSKKISSAASLEEALDSILAIVADLTDFDEAFIYAVDHENEVATVKAARFRGKPEALPPDEPLDSHSVTGWAVTERKALVSPDIRKDTRFSTSDTRPEMVRALMSIPLILQDEVVGVLTIHNYSPNQYSEDDVRVLSIIASQGAAIYKELEALSALTSYTDNILSSITAGVVTLDSDGMILTWNTAAEKIVGLRSERVVGMNFEQALDKLPVDRVDTDTVKRSIKKVFETGDTYQGYKVAFHPRNQHDLYINISISQLLNNAEEQLGLVIIFEDITREIKMEDEFRRMGELAAVGQLAASIAHELRNPLSSIKGAAQFLQKEYENEAAIAEFLSIIIEEVNGLNRLTTEFLDFARPMQLELKPASVNSVVAKTLILMGVYITDNNVVVNQQLAESVPEIQADEKQLEQVLKNIIINSLQAMPSGGMITIETGATPAGGAYISVTDTGVGIPQEKLERIFQPFFTTKTKGTGLGLSVVHKIVENHGGKIEVTSEIDKGTTFRVVLPRSGALSPITGEFDHMMERRMPGNLKHGDTPI